MDFLRAFILGIQDNLISSGKTVKLLKANSEIRSKMAQCFMLNGVVFMFSLVLFEKVLVPIVLLITPAQTTVWMDIILTTIFRVLWVLPLYLISRLLNVFWYQEIANMVYKSVKRSRSKPPTSTISGILADVIYSVVVQSVFLLQASLVGVVPVIGHILQVSHMSVVYALYAFEYVWITQGLGVERRTAIIHCNWAYFLGYGLIMSVVISVASSYFMGVCLFSLMFPVMIVSSHCCVPQSSIKHTPLPLFKPSILITEKLMHLTSRRR